VKKKYPEKAGIGKSASSQDFGKKTIPQLPERLAGVRVCLQERVDALPRNLMKGFERK